MYFAFKSQLSDFIVQEELPFDLAGVGDFFYIFFEKEALNTMDVLMRLCTATDRRRKELGITGLKDKDGMTRQRLSIPRSKVKKIGGETAVLALLNTKVKVLKSGRHDIPLIVGKNRGNRFTIRLRKRAALPLQSRAKLEKNLVQIQKT